MSTVILSFPNVPSQTFYGWLTGPNSTIDVRTLVHAAIAAGWFAVSSRACRYSLWKAAFTCTKATHSTRSRCRCG